LENNQKKVMWVDYWAETGGEPPWLADQPMIQGLLCVYELSPVFKIIHELDTWLATSYFVCPNYRTHIERELHKL